MLNVVASPAPLNESELDLSSMVMAHMELATEKRFRRKLSELGSMAIVS